MKEQIYTISGEILKQIYDMTLIKEYQVLKNRIIYLLSTVENKQLFYNYIDLMDKKLHFLSPAKAYQCGLYADHSNLKKLQRQYLKEVYLDQKNMAIIQERDNIYQELCIQSEEARYCLDLFNTIYHKCEAMLEKKINVCIYLAMEQKEKKAMEKIGLIREMDALGRIVIPSELRREWHISNRSAVEISATKEYIIIKPVQDCCVICGNKTDLVSCKDKYICRSCYYTM